LETKYQNVGKKKSKLPCTAAALFLKDEDKFLLPFQEILLHQVEKKCSNYQKKRFLIKRNDFFSKNLQDSMKSKFKITDKITETKKMEK
jgi:hypothetical protein